MKKNLINLGKLGNKTIRIVSINNELKEKLKSTLSLSPSPYLNRENHLLFSYQKLVSELSPETLALVREFKSHPSASPVLLIRNLPLDDNLSDTPFDGGRASDKKSFISESCLTGFSQILGELYGYTDEKNGELIQNICPIKGQEKANSGEGSNTRFYFHFDNAYFKFRPDYFSLYCLRSDHDKAALTSVMDARDVVESLTKEDIEILKQPLFITPAPDSFRKSHGKTLWSAPRPIIDGSLTFPKLILKLPEMKTLTAEASQAFLNIRNKIMNDEVPSYSVKLEPGDLVFFDNARVMHDRSSFVPRYDGKDR